MMILGIDPGASGALVLIDGSSPVEWTPMPTVKVGSATRVNAAELAAWLADCLTQAQGDLHAHVEQVGAMPGQGVTSMFNFGHSTGTVMGVLGAMEIAHSLVTPQAWKKRAGLMGKDKDAARSRAIQLWPAWRELDAKGKGQAFADAALIALFGMKEAIA